ncbi:MAG TPA: hypothetical protein VF026_09890, partial [Ktedonobacteraceae bacterium]
LAPTQNIAAALAQEQSRRELLPSSVRVMIPTRLARLAPAARQLVRACAVLGNQASAQRLWQVAEVEVQTGVEALEEAVGGGMLREGEAAGGLGMGRPGSYRFWHELMREVVYTELGEARRQVLHQRALALLHTEGARASELAYHALAAGEAEAAYRYNVQAGDEAITVFAVEEAIGHYEQARALLQEHKPLQTVLQASEVDHLYVHLGRTYGLQNTWQRAQEAYEELLAYAQQHQLSTLVSMTLNRLAVLAAQQSKDRSQVRALLEEARRMAETSHDQRALAETEWNWAQITAFVWSDSQKSALVHGERALELARGIQDKELEARNLSTLGLIHWLRGDFEEAIHCEEASLALYAALGNEPSVSRELSITHFMSGVPPTQPLTNRASEAMCWEIMTLSQVHTGQVHDSIGNGRRALALSQEIKNVWVQVNCMHSLAYGLVDVGAYEEALELTQQAVTLARTFPLKLLLCFILSITGSVYQALQQGEEARAAFEEELAVAETIGFRSLRTSRFCMNCAVTGEWEQAYRYALETSTLRKRRMDAALIPLDFYSHYETEALLRAGDESQAREAVLRLGEALGANRRYRLPYLRSLAALAAWERQSDQAIDHLREAARLAADLALPGEQWQIQAALGNLYEEAGETSQAHIAFGEAVRIIQRLAEGIKDETLRARFLAGPQIQPVLQQAQRLGNSAL